MRITACLLTIIVSAGLPAQATLTARVVTDFGGAMDNTADEMGYVSSVVRLPNGHFAVSMTKPIEVRLYDPRGRLLRRLGRAGGGPGEYQSSATVRAWRGDSVLVWSSGTRRWMLFNLSGALVREWGTEAGGPPAGGFALHGSAFIRGLISAGIDCASSTVRRLAPVTAADFQEMMIDPSGRIWLRALVGDRWRVHDQAGRQTATVDLPPRFWVSQFAAGELIGFRLDEDDFPHVVVVKTGLPTLPTVDHTRCVPPTPLVSNVRAAMMKTDLRNMMTTMEAFRADRARYPRGFDEIGRSMFAFSEGNEGTFLRTMDSGYAFAVRDPLTGFRCVVSVGQAIPAWPDGQFACGN